jgi:hypothetical protein
MAFCFKDIFPILFNESSHILGGISCFFSSVGDAFHLEQRTIEVGFYYTLRKLAQFFQNK